MKKPIEHYVSELLFLHDCVIIPEFGGFVGNERSAKIDSDTGTIHPPKKEISFNKNLKNNDGLLINHIAQKEGLNQDVLKKNVLDFSKDLNRKLTESKNIRLNNIGLFSIGNEGNIEFVQDQSKNYSLSGFGLNTIQKPISIKNKISVSNKKPKNERKKQDSTNKVWRAAAILLPLIGLSFISIFQQNEINKVYTRMADTNPVEIIKNIIVDLSNEDIIEQNPIGNTVYQVKNFYIIAGSFEESHNANKMLTELKRNNYNASIVGTNKYGMIRVCYESYKEKEDALLALENIRELNKEAWLLSE